MLRDLKYSATHQVATIGKISMKTNKQKYFQDVYQGVDMVKNE